jgi:uroporphyrinogen III methyltransferase/synthase
MNEKSVKSVVKGFVYLVGAGPGRADLITVRGAEVLKAADCVIYDRLANPALLKFARKDAEIIHVPKRVGSGSCTQGEINRLLVEKASGGQTVVRLKGGDPCVFGRAAEEVATLVDAGIDFEIVPGVTAAIAAAGYTGIILTDREYSSQVVFVTGHEAAGKKQSNIDWSWLAKFDGTIVFYMAMSNLDSIVRQLIENGMEKETPAAVIADATLPTQRTVRASLQLIAGKCNQEQIGPPAIVVIGAAAGSDTRFDWLAKKPLFGKTIVVTRDARGNADFAARIVSQGGSPIEFPTIKIEPLTQTSKFLQALAKFTEYDWVIFTSANGATLFFEYLRGLEKDCRVFGAAKIAVIGEGTAARLLEFGLRADFVPTVFTSEELGKQLIGFTNLQSKNVLLLRSQLASAKLNNMLAQAGARVDSVPIYSIVTKRDDCKWLIERITDGTVDWLTFASSSSASGFFEQIPADLVNSSRAKVASIGPVTSEQLRSLGVTVDVEATEHTLDGLLSAIERASQPPDG